MRKPEDNKIFMQYGMAGPRKANSNENQNDFRNDVDWGAAIGTPIPEKKIKSRESRKGWRHV